MSERRFIAVIHRWHVDSKGFTSHELPSTDWGIAEAQAALIAMKAQGTCCNAGYHLIEIGERECLLPRRLTWKERLTGRLEARHD